MLPFHAVLIRVTPHVFSLVDSLFFNMHHKIVFGLYLAPFEAFYDLYSFECPG